MGHSNSKGDRFQGSQRDLQRITNPHFHKLVVTILIIVLLGSLVSYYLYIKTRKGSAEMRTRIDTALSIGGHEKIEIASHSGDEVEDTIPANGMCGKPIGRACGY